MTNFIKVDDVGFHIQDTQVDEVIKVDDVGLHIQWGGVDEMNKVTGLVAGQYGSATTLTIVDSDGVATDISSYTTITLKATSPDARTTLSFTGTKVGGGTGGQFSFTPTSSNTFDRDGTWEGQVQLIATDVLVLTVIFSLEVDKKI